MKTGMLLNSIELNGTQAEEIATCKLLFSKRYAKQIDKLSTLINVEQAEGDVEVDLRMDLAKA